MPNLTIERNMGPYISEVTKIEKTQLQIPDIDGNYDTSVGQISLCILERSQRGDLLKIQLSGEVLRGTPNKNKWRRKTTKTIDLGNGYGKQTLSKREVIIVS